VAFLKVPSNTRAHALLREVADVSHG
jgi:hypothetical protein